MKRVRIERWSAPLLSAQQRPCLRILQQRMLGTWSNTAVSPTQYIESMPSSNDIIYEDSEAPRAAPAAHRYPISPHPSALPIRFAPSSKLSALHARLALPRGLPLETLARTLVSASAEPSPELNNASLAALGTTILSYHVSEYLICKYPRLPISVLFAASYAYNGPKTLHLLGQEWGVETAAAPGSEVDPGLLQFSKIAPGTDLQFYGVSTRPDAKIFFRRGMTSRIVYDDDFGDRIRRETDEAAPVSTENAYANFVRALVGALYLHAGNRTAKTFVKNHILSRYLDMPSLFQFKHPIRELARLCHRENFEMPVARIISETGRHSRSPVFVVGIFSGADKLGEGSAAALPEARIRASVAALKSWYLYSPGNKVPVPSDQEDPRTKQDEWQPVYIDMGEIVIS